MIQLIKEEASDVSGLRDVVVMGLSQGCPVAILALLNYPRKPTGRGAQSPLRVRQPGGLDSSAGKLNKGHSQTTRSPERGGPETQR
ncbi:hypothetical protein CHU98_g4076 [Xylaria longipes]|nr:hypothetical protein CHU98_g4076 [Xylaria longipes]